MALPDPEPQASRQGLGFVLRAITLVLLVPGLVLIAWVAFDLQGYQNDPQSRAFQTWPAGVTSLVFGISLAWMAIRPTGEAWQKIVAAWAFAAFVVSWILVLN